MQKAIYMKYFTARKYINKSLSQICSISLFLFLPVMTNSAGFNGTGINIEMRVLIKSITYQSVRHFTSGHMFDTN